MKYFYYPKRLAKAKEEIEKVHTNVAESVVVEDLQILRDLIDEIVALEKNELEGYACTLNKKELQMLCMYIPSNKYGVPLDNLLGVVSYQLSELRMRTLYQYWQNNYSYQESFSIFTMIQNQEKFHKMFKERNKVDCGKIAESIRNERVLKLYISFLHGTDLESIEAYQKALLRYGLNLEFQLAKDCMKEFYFICAGKVYMDMGEYSLYQKLLSMKPWQLKKLLVNMLKKLTDSQLDEFYKIAEYYETRTGEYGSQKFNDYFSKIPYNLWQKYHAWMNRFKIHKVFINDANNERSSFWKQYSNQAHISFYDSTDAMAIIFEKTIFIEFRTLGPVYHYSREYYNDKVARAVVNYSKESDLKYYLLHGTEPLKRKVHIGYWQHEIARQIQTYEYSR